MKIEVYEKLVENVEAFERQKATLRSCHEIAVSEVTEARSNLSAAAASGQVKEVMEAQARLAIAEEKLRNTPTVDSGPEMPKGAKNAYLEVHAAISALIGRDAFIEEFQPLLDELAELRSRYMNTLEIFLKKKDQVNDELIRVQQDAKTIRDKYVKSVDNRYADTTMRLLEDYHFRRWVWVENDYYNELSKIQNRLLKESGAIFPIRFPPNEIVLPEQPLVTQGQHIIDSRNIPTSELRILGKAPRGSYAPLGGD